MRINYQSAEKFIDTKRGGNQQAKSYRVSSQIKIHYRELMMKDMKDEILIARILIRMEIDPWKQRMTVKEKSNYFEELKEKQRQFNKILDDGTRAAADLARTYIGRTKRSLSNEN